MARGTAVPKDDVRGVQAMIERAMAGGDTPVEPFEFPVEGTNPMGVSGAPLGREGGQIGLDEVLWAGLGLTPVGTVGRGAAGAQTLRGRQIAQNLPGHTAQAAGRRAVEQARQQGVTGATRQEIDELVNFMGRARASAPRAPAIARGEKALRTAQQATKTGAAIRSPMAFDLGQEMGMGTLDALADRRSQLDAETMAALEETGAAEEEDAQEPTEEEVAAAAAAQTEGGGGREPGAEDDERGFISRLLGGLGMGAGAIGGGLAKAGGAVGDFVGDNQDAISSGLLAAGAAAQEDPAILMNTIQQIEQARQLQDQTEIKQRQEAFDDFRAVQRMVEPTARQLGISPAPLVRSRMGTASSEDMVIIQEALERYNERRSDPLGLQMIQQLSGQGGGFDDLDNALQGP